MVQNSNILACGLTFMNQFEGQKLTEIINKTHVNKKYLPDVQLPENLVAIPDITEAVRGATALVFVMPHQCKSINSQCNI